MSPFRYLMTLVGTASLGMACIGLAVWLIDPFGLSPLHVRLQGLNTIKLARNTNDRLVKPYDAIRMQPRTIIIGTSRVKQAFNPALVKPEYQPVYNAGIDSLKLSEAKRLLAFYFREQLPIERVWLEVFPLQFGFVAWGPDFPVAGDSKLDDMASATFSTFAIRSAVATVMNSFTDNGVAVQPDGWRPVGDYGHAGPGFVSPQWMHTLTQTPIIPLRDQPFSDLDDIIAMCAQHGVELKIFIGPIHPALAYVYLTTNRGALRTWLARVSTRHDVLSFLTAPDFVEHRLDDPKPYFMDSTHFSVPAARLMVRELEAEPSKARLLNPATAQNIFLEWETQIQTWAGINSGYARTIRGIFD